MHNKQILLKLVKAIKQCDDFSARLIIARLLNLGYKSQSDIANKLNELSKTQGVNNG